MILIINLSTKFSTPHGCLEGLELLKKRFDELI